MEPSFDDRAIDHPVEVHDTTFELSPVPSGRGRVDTRAVIVAAEGIDRCERERVIRKSLQTCRVFFEAVRSDISARDLIRTWHVKNEVGCEAASSRRAALSCCIGLSAA
jgi:hypothetical protein